ncbi:MAG TPA: DegT/DnrJ/EryC1/StrS family aminotransferase [Chloroflexota bacterium]|nr:DegT/DnrJ/EryC1/StrS family aminotransferase [Chloroflexota bacterium]
MSTSSDVVQGKQLAINGGEPAIRHPVPAMYPGGMRIGAEEEDAVLDVLRSKRLFRYYGPQQGPSRVAELEEAFARMIGTSFAQAVGSGTTALTAALAALEVGPGDEVIVPAYTWISTPAAVMAMGGVPILAEVDDSLTLDPEDFAAKSTSRTRAVIPVHMRGAPSNMAPIMAIARRHGIAVIEDTAQADGGSYRGRRLGSIGDLGTFSLQFNKILTAGEGGMVTTNDQRLFRRVLMYHDVAAGERSELPADERFLGINTRLSELQAAVLLVQLKRLDSLLEDMRRNKTAIKNGIADLAAGKGVRFRTLNDAEGDTAIALVFYLPTVDEARSVVQALEAEGLPADVLFSPENSDYHIYYHWSPVLNRRSWSATTPWDLHPGEVTYSQDMCPRTLDLLARAVHIDISPDLTSENVAEMTEALTKVLGSLPDRGS